MARVNSKYFLTSGIGFRFEVLRFIIRSDSSVQGSTVGLVYYVSDSRCLHACTLVLVHLGARFRIPPPFGFSSRTVKRPVETRVILPSKDNQRLLRCVPRGVPAARPPAMLNHADDVRSNGCVDEGGAGEQAASQEILEEQGETDEPGFGLGLPGLASLTLPAEGMVVPPLNFSMVRWTLKRCSRSGNKYDR